MAVVDFWRIGSFQRVNIFESENPLEEVWSQIARIGTPEHLARLSADKPEVDWKQHCAYAEVRINRPWS